MKPIIMEPIMSLVRIESVDSDKSLDSGIICNYTMFTIIDTVTR